MYTIERLYDSIFLDESKNLSLKNCSSKLHWKVHHFRTGFYSTAHRRFDEKAGFFRVSVPRIFGGNAGNPLPFYSLWKN